MTTLVKIENAANSNGDVILDGTNTCEGAIRGAVLEPGQSRELWITTGSVLVIGERWPTRKNEPTESAGDFMTRIGTDGEKWAAEFCKRVPGVEQDTARAWFQNAIEAGRSAGYSEGEKSRGS